MKKGIIIALSTLILIITGINKINASEFQVVNTNFYNIFNGSSDVTISSDTNLSYKTTTNFEATNYYSLNLPSSKYLSIPENSNYIYFQTYTKFWNGENSNVLNFNYNFNVGLSFNTWNVTTCTQLSNTSEHNVGYITWKCPIPSTAETITKINFYGFNQQLDNILDTTSDFIYGVYNWFIIFDVSETGTIIDNQQETNDILTGEQNFNKNPSEEVNGKEEINDYTEKEEQLFSSLDFEGIEDNEIVINPNTSSFIWEIIDRLRGMNGKIVLLMTSILGLGIIKMVLNR